LWRRRHLHAATYGVRRDESRELRCRDRLVGEGRKGFRVISCPSIR
jgi:hypothetical protein